MIEVRLYGIDTAELVPRIPKIGGTYYEVKIDNQEKLEHAMQQRHIESTKARNARNYLIKQLTDINIQQFLDEKKDILKQEKY